MPYTLFFNLSLMTGSFETKKEPDMTSSDLQEYTDSLGFDSKYKVPNELKVVQDSLFQAVGPNSSKIIFIEGSSEDTSSQSPYEGESGQLMEKMINAMGFTQDQIHAINIVKSTSDSAHPVLEYLKDLNPEYVVGFGQLATETLLNLAKEISEIRGAFQELNIGDKKLQFMPTFHPRYLLKKPSEKKTVWSDLQKVMAVL